MVDCYLDWHHTNTRQSAHYGFAKRFGRAMNPEEKTVDVNLLEK